MKCLNKQNEILLFLVTNGDSTLVFYMGVNSIRADKLSPLVPRILNKNESNIFGQFLCVCSSSLIFLIHGYFMTFMSVRDLFLKFFELKYFYAKNSSLEYWGLFQGRLCFTSSHKVVFDKSMSVLSVCWDIS